MCGYVVQNATTIVVYFRSGSKYTIHLYLVSVEDIIQTDAAMSAFTAKIQHWN